MTEHCAYYASESYPVRPIDLVRSRSDYVYIDQCCSKRKIKVHRVTDSMRANMSEKVDMRDKKQK